MILSDAMRALFLCTAHESELVVNEWTLNQSAGARVPAAGPVLQSRVDHRVEVAEHVNLGDEDAPVGQHLGVVEAVELEAVELLARREQHRDARGLRDERQVHAQQAEARVRHEQVLAVHAADAERAPAVRMVLAGVCAQVQ